ncbi:MAG: hypothetical protein V3V62_00290, partial [bacterium]
MSKDRWAVHLCSCNGALPVSGKEIGRLAGLDADPLVHKNLARGGPAGFMKGAELGADFHLVCCCSPEESFSSALAEAGVEEEQVVHLDIKGGAFWRLETPEEGNRLAARLIRSKIARLETRRGASPISLAVPPTVLIYTDRPEGLRLADRLSERMTV